LEKQKADEYRKKQEVECYFCWLKISDCLTNDYLSDMFVILFSIIIQEKISAKLGKHVSILCIWGFLSSVLLQLHSFNSKGLDDDEGNSSDIFAKKRKNSEDEAAALNLLPKDEVQKNPTNSLMKVQCL
jgi:hypothetical protein